MNSIWVVAIVLTMNGQQPQKVLMLDGHAYASHGLCEVSGMIKIGNDLSYCEEIPIRKTK